MSSDSINNLIFSTNTNINLNTNLSNNPFNSFIKPGSKQLQEPTFSLDVSLIKSTNNQANKRNDKYSKPILKDIKDYELGRIILLILELEKSQKNFDSKNNPLMMSDMSQSMRTSEYMQIDLGNTLN